jgi:uncharacterized membrane protein HdeD (DUF308 family)
MDNDGSDDPCRIFLGIGLYKLFAKALKPKFRRRVLLFFLFLMATSIVLDVLQYPYSEFFGVAAIAGATIYLGISLLSVLPPKWDECILFRLLGISMILVGTAELANFVIDRALQFIDTIK